ncbi:MAG: phosphorylase, partial [Bacteroidetes bacterium]|nr:phosphorylase [Bacteroidota bacterium]
MSEPIAPSELILNADGSIYHLNLLPNEIGDRIILVGDPARVEQISSFFDEVEIRKQKREFITNTGYYKGKRVSVISTGIGTDNIDIVLNELDILANYDLETRTAREERKALRFIRLGTC